mgnify:CR=1 FL=1
MAKISLYLSIFIILIASSCKTEKKKDFEITHSKELAIKNKVHIQLSDIEIEQGWSLLFDGKTLDGWHLFNKPDSTQFSAWKVQNGRLFCDATDETKVFGDLVTDKAYENYELQFDWQMALRGNGGVFINVQESPEYKATYNTGPEYQLLEPEHMDTKTPLKRPGTLWGLSPQLNTVEANPVGQWNTTRIIQKDGKIQFYLNGILTVEEEINSTAWKNKIADSNFKNAPDFGKASQGKIALQNWYFESWFRNVKIREL